MSRPLNGRCQFALMPSTYARSFTWHNFSKRRNVASQGIRILIVNVVHAVHAKIAILRHWFLFSSLHHIG